MAVNTRNHIEDALREAESTVYTLENALRALDKATNTPLRQSMPDDEDAFLTSVNRLHTVSVSILNQDGVFTRYDFALAIRELERFS